MRRGFTLLELLIVIAIFSIVALISISSFLTTFRVSQSSSLENAVLDDARYILTTLAREIQSGTIDFEEYFSQCVASGSCPNQDPDNIDWGGAAQFGVNYGLYDWQFMYGGYQVDDDTFATHGYGTRCQVDAENYEEFPNEDCVTGPLAFTADTNTGQNPNPIKTTDPNVRDGSAMCVSNDLDYFQRFTDAATINTADPQSVCGPGGFDYTDLRSYMVNELYLIDARGEQKTIIGRERVNDTDNWVISKVELVKIEQAQKLETGESMPLFAFTCASGYICTGTNDQIDSLGDYPSQLSDDISVPLRDDLYEFTADEDYYKDFVPISPLRVNIKSLKFVIGPPEDPRRAFAEDDPLIQMQPQVTILLELEPSEQFNLPFLSPGFNLEFQTTVTSSVLEEVPIISEE